jgi:hypothetical protein
MEGRWTSSICNAKHGLKKIKFNLLDGGILNLENKKR